MSAATTLPTLPPNPPTADASSSPLPAFAGLTRDELSTHLAGLGQPAFRARQVFPWFYGPRRVASFEEMTDLPAGLRGVLAAGFRLSTITPVRRLGAADTTQKFLFRLDDGQLVESVLIPASPALYGETSDRRTLCVSSQVGCAYGCKFCASGLDGWTRNLQPGEIVEQILQAERIGGARVDNVVFMGMGEPLANFDNVLKAITILNAPWGLNIGARHLTVSTSGLPPQIERLAAQPLPIRLAISLHGATDEVRGRIMPVNRRYPLAALMAACRVWRAQKRMAPFFEFILIAGVNDSEDQAHALANLVRPLEGKVNLIPYNTVEGLDWERPSPEVCEGFLRVLRNRGVVATLRREKGHDIAAACGQLRRQTAAGAV